MKKIIIVIFALGFTCLHSHSQMIYTASDGKTYLDCTAKSNMPAAAVTRTPKCVTGTASLTTMRAESKQENEKVFEKLEIDNANLVVDGTTYLGWVTAYNGCKAKNINGVKGWRLPTQKELLLLAIFNKKLGTFGEAGSCFTATEATDNTIIFVTMQSCYTTTTSRQASMLARCVREVTL